MSEKTAVQIIQERADEQRSKGNTGLAELFEKQVAQGEDHCREYIEIMSMVGKSVRGMRERGELDF